MQLNSLDSGAVVRRAREDIGLSQGALAQAAGLQQSDLAAIETGARRAIPEMLDRILGAARLRPSPALELLADQVRSRADDRGLRNFRPFSSAVLGTDHERSDVDLPVTADLAVDYLAPPPAAIEQRSCSALR